MQILSDTAIVSDATWEQIHTMYLSGMERAEAASVLAKLPSRTVLVGYAAGPVAAFLSDEKMCLAWEKNSLQATFQDGICALHAGRLDDGVFAQTSPSLAASFGAILPDQPTGIALVLPERFGYGEVLTKVLGDKITPDVLLVRTLAQKFRFISASLSYDAGGTFNAVVDLVFPKEYAFTKNISDVRLSGADVEKAAPGTSFIAVALDPVLPSAWTDWLTKTYGDDASRMVQFRLMAVTEGLTPVAIEAENLPSASLFLNRVTNPDGATLVGVNDEEMTGINQAIMQALMFTYGLRETSTTLPDKSKGTLVVASKEAIATKVATQSGITMTEYIADGETRLKVAQEQDIVQIFSPIAGTGSTLSAPDRVMSAMPWRFPLANTYAVLLGMPLAEDRFLSLGASPMGDRLRFDIVLSQADSQ